MVDVKKEVRVRDMRYKAVHRGGTLELKQHQLLALWAADCAEHVLPLFESHRHRDNRPREAIKAARAWAAGKITVGDARNIALAAHAAARACTDVPAREAARAAGHAVATAHMADHSAGPAWYAVRAVQAGKGDAAAEQERLWQLQRLPAEIRELVETTLQSRKFTG